MKKYLSFFRLRFLMGLQYRAAALGGIATQFAWGFMDIMIFRAFYRADPAAFPMSLYATASYIWLQQAFLALFATWMMEKDVFDSIVNGNIAYELCRPVSIYNMWFSRSMATRLSRAVLRCFPILAIAIFVPQPYGIAPPASPWHFIVFLATLFLGLAMTDFFAGALIPLPFFPAKMQSIMELLPFAAMQNVPLRVYSGSMTVYEMQRAIVLQIFWLFVTTAAGKLLCKLAQKRVIVQGG